MQRRRGLYSERSNINAETLGGTLLQTGLAFQMRTEVSTFTTTESAGKHCIADLSHIFNRANSWLQHLNKEVHAYEIGIQRHRLLSKEHLQQSWLSI